MTVTLDNLIYATRLRLGDHVQEGYDTATGDGVTDRFRLTHDTLLAKSCSILVDDVPDLTATVDEYTGWVRFSSVPTGDISFSYQYTVWSDERVTEAINSAIDELFGKFYVRGINDELWSEGGAEFVAQTSAGVDLGPDDRITRVEYWNGSRWIRTDRWSVQVQGDTKVIVFEQTPAAGVNFRISYVTRPGSLVGTSDSLEVTAGLPSRAKEPIVLLACSSLIVERMHHRIRDDRSHNTQNDNTVKSYEIQNDAQFLRAQAMLIAQSLKMDSLAGRVTL